MRRFVAVTRNESGKWFYAVAMMNESGNVTYKRDEDAVGANVGLAFAAALFIAANPGRIEIRPDKDGQIEAFLVNPSDLTKVQMDDWGKKLESEH